MIDSGSPGLIVSAEEVRLFGFRNLTAASGVQDIWVYTDGSACDSRNGGAGVVIVHGNVTDPVLIEKIVCPAGLIVSSFQAELHAILS